MAVLLRLEKVEEVVVKVKGFVSTGSGEDRLVGDVCKLLIGLGHARSAEGLVELVSRLDREINIRSHQIADATGDIDDLEIVIDRLAEELKGKVDRIDFLERELGRRGELELKLGRVLG